MLNKKHLGTITILVKDRHTQSGEVNRLLTDNGHLILARLGVNLSRVCVKNCTAMISVAIEGTGSEIKSLTKKLNGLYGIVAKAAIVTD